MNKAHVLLNQRIFILLLAIVLAWCLPAGPATASEAAGTLEWERDFGPDIGLINVFDTGNGYSVIGVDKESHLVYIAKLSTDGTIYWNKELELLTSKGIRAVLEAASTTRDGGYILGATIPGSHSRSSDFYAARITPEGSLEWDTEYQSGAHASFDDIHESRDGGFLYANNAESLFLSGFFRATIGKFNADGSLAWVRELGRGAARDPLVRNDQIIELEDGSYLISGSKNGKAYVWRFDDNVNLNYSKEYRQLLAGRAAAADDGGYTLAGTQQEHITLYKHNKADENVSVQTLDLTGQVEALHSTSQGGYLLGTSEGVYEINSNGDILWIYELSGVRQAIPTADGGAAVISGGKLLKLGSSIDRLEFDSPDYSLIEGQTLDTVLTAVYGGERKVVANLNQVVFSSDDESIVTIDPEGNITGQKLGSTYIRAALNGAEAVARVHVFKTHKSLQLDSSEYQINVGQPIDLIVTYFEGASRSNVTTESSFSTSDPSVAIVDEDGKLIGLQQGQTILKATYNGLEASAIVDVY